MKLKFVVKNTDIVFIKNLNDLTTKNAFKILSLHIQTETLSSKNELSTYDESLLEKLLVEQSVLADKIIRDTLIESGLLQNGSSYTDCNINIDSVIPSVSEILQENVVLIFEIDIFKQNQ